jgi:hypothetical protein
LVLFGRAGFSLSNANAKAVSQKLRDRQGSNSNFVFFVWSPGVFVNRLSPTKKSPKLLGVTFASPSRKEYL